MHPSLFSGGRLPPIGTGRNVRHNARGCIGGTGASDLKTIKDEICPVLVAQLSNLTDAQKDELVELIDLLVVTLRSRYSGTPKKYQIGSVQDGFEVDSTGLAFQLLKMEIIPFSKDAFAARTAAADAIARQLIVLCTHRHTTWSRVASYPRSVIRLRDAIGQPVKNTSSLQELKHTLENFSCGFYSADLQRRIRVISAPILLRCHLLDAMIKYFNDEFLPVLERRDLRFRETSALRDELLKRTFDVFYRIIEDPHPYSNRMDGASPRMGDIKVIAAMTIFLQEPKESHEHNLTIENLNFILQHPEQAQSFALSIKSFVSQLVLKEPTSPLDDSQSVVREVHSRVRLFWQNSMLSEEQKQREVKQIEHAFCDFRDADRAADSLDLIHRAFASTSQVPRFSFATMRRV